MTRQYPLYLFQYFFFYKAWRQSFLLSKSCLNIDSYNFPQFKLFSFYTLEENWMHMLYSRILSLMLIISLQIFISFSSMNSHINLIFVDVNKSSHRVYCIPIWTQTISSDTYSISDKNDCHCHLLQYYLLLFFCRGILLLLLYLCEFLYFVSYYFVFFFASLHWFRC